MITRNTVVTLTGPDRQTLRCPTSFPGLSPTRPYERRLGKRTSERGCALSEYRMKPLTAKGAFHYAKNFEYFGGERNGTLRFAGKFSSQSGPPDHLQRWSSLTRRSDRPTETCRSISKNSRFQLRSYQNLDRNEIESCDPVGKLLSIEKCSSIFSCFLTSPAGREHA